MRKPPDDCADRCRDLRGRQFGGRALVQQRLKQVVITLVSHSEVNRRPSQRLDDAQTTETSPEHHDVWTAGLPALHGIEFARWRSAGLFRKGLRQMSIY